MFDMITTLRTRFEKHAAYRRTVNEIKHMPIETALDLDIYQGDAERIAARAVYGR